MRMDSERKVTAAGEPLIEFRDVDKFFDKPEEGRYQVVGDLNIKVRENEFLVLFGPGQCGKSTILNLIAGFEMPSSGHVLCMGKDITGPGPDRGMVFQNTALFPWLTVMGNVEYGPKVRGIKKEERRRGHSITLIWSACRDLKIRSRSSCQAACSSVSALPVRTAMSRS